MRTLNLIYKGKLLAGVGFSSAQGKRVGLGFFSAEGECIGLRLYRHNHELMLLAADQIKNVRVTDKTKNIYLNDR